MAVLWNHAGCHVFLTLARLSADPLGCLLLERSQCDNCIVSISRIV